MTAIEALAFFQRGFEAGARGEPSPPASDREGSAWYLRGHEAGERAREDAEEYFWRRRVSEDTQ